MRIFDVITISIDGRKVSRSLCANTPHSAARLHIERNHPGYFFTGGLQTVRQSWQGEAYNETHGLNVYVNEL